MSSPTSENGWRSPDDRPGTASVRAILMYHSIDPSGSVISVDPATFRRQGEWLASGRVRVVDLAEVERGEPEEDVVALTFDDGFANFGEVAAPVLRDLGLPATVFVVTDRVGTTNEWDGRPSPGIPSLPLLDWDGLGRVAGAGITLGAHTRRHPRLSRLAPAEQRAEIEGSAARLEAETGRRPAAFAYPYGDLNDSAAGLAAAGFALACTTEFRPLGPGEAPHLLPRLDMYYFRQPGSLEAWGTAPFRWRLRLRGQARRLRAALHG